MLCFQVLACPPGSCLAQGTGCTGFEFFGVANGKPGEELQCNIINEMAAVGTVFELKFFVRDLTKPKGVQGATATRTITIVEPCDDGEQFCEDDRTCSAVLPHSAFDTSRHAAALQSTDSSPRWQIECAQRGQIIQESLEDKPPVVRLNVRLFCNCTLVNPVCQVETSTVRLPSLLNRMLRMTWTVLPDPFPGRRNCPSCIWRATLSELAVLPNSRGN